MKRLMSFMVFAFFAFTMCFTQAAGLDSESARAAGFGKLSEIEKAEVLKVIADKASKSSNSIIDNVSNAKKVDEWLNVGERIGKMIGGAAKEVGMVVNDFVKTPVGMIAMALIVWTYMGGVLVHVLGGVLILLSSFAFIWWLARRNRTRVVLYDPDKTDKLGRSLLVSDKTGPMEDYVFGWSIAIFVVGWGAALIAMFTF